MSIYVRVQDLRKKMLERGVDAYIVPTSDPHQSEYVADYYRTREFISGFTGSAGTAVITRDKCGLWTDGRYFLQAEQELKNTPFELYRMGTDDLTMEAFLIEEVPAFGKIGFDGRCMATSTYKELSKSMGKRMLLADLDFIGDIWTDRPALPSRPAYHYDIQYTGQTTEEKLKVLRTMLRMRDADMTLIGALEDVCYLYNIRGWDVESTPVVISYALVSQKEALLFVNRDKLDDELLKKLSKAGVTVYDYDAIDAKLEEVKGQTMVYLDPTHTNISLFQKLGSNVKVQTGINLTSLMKAIKNDVEIENAKKAYLKDGVALVKFFNWLETGVKTGNINEVAAADKLHAFRKEGENFLEDSFSTIAGYGENAAIVHYDPRKNPQPARLRPRGLFLLDSGGQYLEGTTDITRTLALGETTIDEKTDYTLVLKAHIAGMTARFLEGTTGSAIDAVVRNPMLRAGKDFNHGTGHGVGHLLSVHEGPQSISRKDRGVEIAPGMVTSMEPGLYITGSHGIRTESITLCVVKEKNEFGMFLGFEPLTWVPIDTRPVLGHMLEAWERDWLNEYNKTCYEKLSPQLEGEALAYLENLCRAL